MKWIDATIFYSANYDGCDFYAYSSDADHHFGNLSTDFEYLNACLLDYA